MTFDSIKPGFDCCAGVPSSFPPQFKLFMLPVKWRPSCPHLIWQKGRRPPLSQFWVFHSHIVFTQALLFQQLVLSLPFCWGRCVDYPAVDDILLYVPHKMGVTCCCITHLEYFESSLKGTHPPQLRNMFCSSQTTFQGGISADTVTRSIDHVKL